MDEPRIRVKGLTKLDRRDLGDAPGINYEEATLDSGMFGEVGTFTVIVTMALVSTLAAYLLRKHGGQSFEEDVEIIHRDGRVEKRRIRFRADQSEAPQADIIRQIQAGSTLPGTQQQ
jgi:hypothetical protein